METFYKVWMHIMEAAITIGGAWVLLTYFGLDNDMQKLVVGLAVNGLAKFVRASESIPVYDYVNK